MEEKTVISTVSRLSSDEREVIQVLGHQAAAEKGSDGAANTGPGGGIGSSESVSIQITVKKKRGRPRKYDHMLEKTTLLASPPSGFSSPLSVTCEKRRPGRPRGTGRLQLLANSLCGYYAETAGGNLTPYVITVETGEDLVSKIMSFSQNGYKALCILSATGAVSSVVIRQPGSSGGFLRYEGRFEILTLTGSFTFGETTGTHRKSGNLSVSLAKPDGRVFGGGVVGPLIASGPIQLIVGSFRQNISKELKKRRQSAESSSTAACVMNIGGNNNSDINNNNTNNNNQNVIINNANQSINNNGAADDCTTPTSAINHVGANQDVIKSEDDAQMINNNFQISDEINHTI